MESKPGYKRTEVGVVPEDWEVKPLWTLSEKIMVGIASAATHAYRDRGVVMFRNQNIKPGYLDDSDVLYIAEEYEVTFKNKRLKSGDLLTARTGYPGTTSIVPEKYEGAQSFTTLVTRPRKNAVDSAYLCCFINSEAGQLFFEQNQIGGGQKNVNAGSLKILPVPIPPTKAEQEAIAEALSDADALIESLDQLIAKMRALKQGAMQELLTGKKRLPGFSGDWEVRRIGEVIDLLTGFPFPSVGYVSSGIRLLRGSNVKRGVTDWADDISQYWPATNGELAMYELRAGDLVISMDGSLVGRSYAQIKSEDLPALLLQRVARIRSTKKLNVSYLAAFVGSDWFVKYTDSVKTVSAIPHIGPGDIANFSIPCPPTVEEQTAIATILSDMDTELAELQSRLAKARQIKQGMMQELLTGRIRLL